MATPPRHLTRRRALQDSSYSGGGRGRREQWCRQGLPFALGVLIHAMRGWHVALYQVPTYACRALRTGGQVVVETVAGHRLAGHAVTEFVTQGGGYVLLSGGGRLRRESPSRAA